MKISLQNLSYFIIYNSFGQHNTDQTYVLTMFYFRFLLFFNCNYNKLNLMICKSMYHKNLEITAIHLLNKLQIISFKGLSRRSYFRRCLNLRTVLYVLIIDLIHIWNISFWIWLRICPLSLIFVNCD